MTSDVLEFFSVRRNNSPGYVLVIFMIGYVSVHLVFQYGFWISGDTEPFAKYAVRQPDADSLTVATQAYLAKSTWLVLTVVLLTFKQPIRIAFGIGTLVFGVVLLVLFGPIWLVTVSIVAGLGMLVEGRVQDWVDQKWLPRRAESQGESGLRQ